MHQSSHISHVFSKTAICVCTLPLPLDYFLVLCYILKMLLLYTKTGCPFCAKVLDYVRAEDIELEERNIADEENRKELIEKGGEQQVPYLDDTEKNIRMYESDDIIDYLRTHFASKA